MEYLGRSDDQLKIRGQRIELGEIDRAMLSLPDVAQAVAHACVFNRAAATGGDARQLVGYVVSESGLPLDRDALLESLKTQLPPHMVPVVLLQISALPLSANGKLDRKALPLPELTGKTSGRAPESETEIAVAQAFAALLGCGSTTLRRISLPSAATRCWRCVWRRNSAARSTARSRRGKLWSPRR